MVKCFYVLVLVVTENWKKIAICIQAKGLEYFNQRWNPAMMGEANFKLLKKKGFYYCHEKYVTSPDFFFL